MYISRHNLTNIYDKIVINEMRQNVIDYVKDNKQDLPFDHIFGDDLRIAVPILGDDTAADIINSIKSIKDYSGLEFDDSGEVNVIRKVKLDPKYGGGEKNMKMKLSSAIPKISAISDEQKKKYLDWLALYRKNLKDMVNGKSRYTLVLSRSPLDVVKMSELDNIPTGNCHRYGNQYFQCAVQEAISGGGVAFVVKTRDLEDYLNNGNNLQDEEFMFDTDREIDGIKPVSRVRIRRFVNDDDEIAIPETIIYGDKKIPSIYTTLKSFLKSKQPITQEKFIEGDWKKRGGTYEDNDAKYLVNGYFDGKLPDAPMGGHYRDDSNEESDLDMYELSDLDEVMDDECRVISQEFNRHSTYITIGYDIINNEYPPLIHASNYCVYRDFPNDIDVSHIDFTLHDEYQYFKALRGEYDDDDIYWSVFLKQVFDNYGVALSYFNIEHGRMNINIKNDDEFYFMNSSDEYKDYARYLRKFDNDLSRIDEDEWYTIFKDCNIVNNNSDEDALERFSKLSSDDMTFDDDSNDRHVEWDILIDSITDDTFNTYVTPSDYARPKVSDKISTSGNKFSYMLFSYIEDNYKINTTKSEKNQLFEGYYNTVTSSKFRQLFEDYNIEDLKVMVYTITSGHKGSANLVKFSIKINVTKFNDDNVDLFLFLDKHYNDLKHIASFCYLSEHAYITSQTPKYKNYLNSLKIVYGKYANGYV